MHQGLLYGPNQMVVIIFLRVELAQLERNLEYFIQERGDRDELSKMWKYFK